MLAASTRRSTSPGPGVGRRPLDELAAGPGRVLASARIVAAPTSIAALTGRVR